MEANTQSCSLDRVMIERVVARGFVVAGGVFWAIATFAGLYTFRQTGVPAALIASFWPLFITATALAIGWYFERTAAILLYLGALTVLLVGVTQGWDPIIFGVMVLALAVPMAISATLFLLARREERRCAASGVLMPGFTPVRATRSQF